MEETDGKNMTGYFVVKPSDRTIPWNMLHPDLQASAILGQQLGSGLFSRLLFPLPWKLQDTHLRHLIIQSRCKKLHVLEYGTVHLSQPLHLSPYLCYLSVVTPGKGLPTYTSQLHV